MADKMETYGEGAEDFRQAEYLARYLRGEWRYDHTTTKWHKFDGIRWAIDDGKKVHKAVADVVKKRIACQ